MLADETLLQFLYKDIIIEFSEATGKDLKESLRCFYKSKTYKLISNGVSDMHCRSPKYLADELMLELGLKKHISYTQ